LSALRKTSEPLLVAMSTAGMDDVDLTKDMNPQNMANFTVAMKTLMPVMQQRLNQTEPVVQRMDESKLFKKAVPVELSNARTCISKAHGLSATLVLGMNLKALKAPGGDGERQKANVKTVLDLICSPQSPGKQIPAPPNVVKEARFLVGYAEEAS